MIFLQHFCFSDIKRYFWKIIISNGSKSFCITNYSILSFFLGNNPWVKSNFFLPLLRVKITENKKQKKLNLGNGLSSPHPASHISFIVVVLMISNSSLWMIINYSIIIKTTTINEMRDEVIIWLLFC